MAWDALTAAMVDADSPVNSTLMEAIRNRLEWLLSSSDHWNTSGIAAGSGLASASHIGLLSTTDWSTFNGKQAAITGGSGFYVGQTSGADNTFVSTGIDRAHGVATCNYSAVGSHMTCVKYSSSLFYVGQNSGGTRDIEWLAWN